MTSPSATSTPPAHDPSVLPPGLPVPTNDGAAAHLLHAALPPISLPSTSGAKVPLAELDRAVIFLYPRTGVPAQPPAPGFAGEDWDSIPGARGCTPQACAFRDIAPDFNALGVRVMGLSTNSTAHQAEFAQRTRSPFDFLSDARLELTGRLRLPTFRFPVESGGPSTLLKRMAWYVERDAEGRARIARVWYPVFPPDRNADTVLAWLRRRAEVRVRPATDADLPFVRAELSRHWGHPGIWSLGRQIQADRLPALIAEVDDTPQGLVTYDLQPGGYQCEIVTLSARREDFGIGSRLLHAAVNEARRAGCVRAFLTTSNDNVRALGFYQREGWRLAALHKGAIDQARRRVPTIPVTGHFAIPVRDEIELEFWLRPGAPAFGDAS